MNRELSPEDSFDGAWCALWDAVHLATQGAVDPYVDTDIWAAVHSTVREAVNTTVERALTETSRSISSSLKLRQFLVELRQLRRGTT